MKTIAHGESESSHGMLSTLTLVLIYFRDQMIEKIGYVMGCDFYMDPDPSYALTADNLIKILAIQMRFR